MAQVFNQSFEQKLIYVYRINDEAHAGILKIGEASCNAGMAYFAFEPNCNELNIAAKKRIDQQTQTAGVSYELLYTEATACMRGKNLIVFQDHEVHNILERSGIRHKYFDPEHKANEWFYTDLETVKKAIAAAKEERSALTAGEISQDKSPFPFRKEQREAIDKTVRQFKKKSGSHQMLWNAKMRFGKTLAALQVVKECNFRRTLILTHRPVVNNGWFDEYQRIFYDRLEYMYGSKKYASLESCERLFNEPGGGSYIYFASIQDMRGSELVGGKYAKNEDVFAIDWDLIIIDEAHEGTQTELGKSVFNACKKENTCVLYLSGTPFNLMDDFKEDEIYTWDYVMEQRAKAEWEALHQGDPNPYAALPRMNIFTYNLGELFAEYVDADIAFNFKEFFRVDEDGEFIHKINVKQFLDLISKEDDESNYPYSKAEYRENFRHSLWIIPGVKEAKALSRLLQEHPVFSQFNIANVAGDGDEEVNSSDALALVEKAIGEHPEESYSITLSCGRLTTGVTVKPWTACFMLAGSYSTSASSYMQTIFRVQTPAIIGGRQKEECFVFDFAPDRTLKVIAETAKISARAGKTTQNDRKILGEFLNFCPIIGFEGSRMQNYDTEKMLGQLKKVYVERVVRSGFEDNYLYNDELMKLDQIALGEFEDLKKIIGSTKAMAKTGDININALGFTAEEFEELEKQKNHKEKRELTPEEQEARARLLEAKKNRDTAISILRGISIRMPLLIYGADLKKNILGEEEPITIENFTKLVDDVSWEEFMPKGVTKELFKLFKKYYDTDVFREAGIKIRQMARAADKLPIEERIERISIIFNTFRNPDKETVLTPWRVVNMHLAGALGGYSFWDENFNEPSAEPHLVIQGKVTGQVFRRNTHILEINAKSGLYALYAAYSVYRARKLMEIAPRAARELEQALWASVLRENIFVICKTPMARSITKRTLAGFTGAAVNIVYIEDLVKKLRNQNSSSACGLMVYQELLTAFGEKNMKFDAVVGNPPYQEETGGSGRQATPVYNLFFNVAKKLAPDYISMIMPSRWFSGGFGLDSFREQMLNDERLRLIVDFPKSTDAFPTVDIAGGICYILWDKNYTGLCEVINVEQGIKHSAKRKLNEYKTFVRYSQALPIIKKIFDIEKPKQTLENTVSQQRPFGLPTNYRPLESGIPCYFIQKIGKKFAALKDISDPSNLLNKWKLLVPKAPIAGQTDFTKPVGFYYDGNTRIAEPGACCTESFIVAGAFDTKEEVISFKSYLFTKTVRFLLLQTVISQDVLRNKFCFVPALEKYEGKYTDVILRERWKISDSEWKYIDSRIHNYEK